MPANYVLLERIELNDSASSVTFSNIPQSGYTDLKIVVSARSDLAAVNGYMNIRFNGSSTSISEITLDGTGSVASTNSYSGYLFANVNGNTSTANTFCNVEIYVPNYLSTTASKSISIDSVNETNATAVFSQLVAGLWAKSPAEAINSITLSAVAGNLVSGANFLQYSTFSLYGLAATGTTPVTAPKATGGNTVITDGTYWIHTFTSSGTFTPLASLTCDYLVVAGGGGAGGGGPSGGGGGGGFLTSTGLAVTSQAYAITVGAGGSGGIVSGAQGTNGSNSVFSSITATGGGKGGGYSTSEAQTGANGGSGGGGAGGSNNAGGSASPSGQGNAGGAGITGTSNNRPAGGGGGAGAAGASASGNNGGNGGNGLANSYSGTSVTYAGGGGGGAGTLSSAAGTGGTGGGGNGSKSGSGSAGTVNLGGGGGGAENSGSGGNGGSGIVIIRYPV